MIKQKVSEYIGEDLVNFEEEKTFSGNGRDLYHCVKNLIESGCTDEIILDRYVNYYAYAQRVLIDDPSKFETSIYNFATEILSFTNVVCKRMVGTIV
jgi:hypothetical protein